MALCQKILLRIKRKKMTRQKGVIMLNKSVKEVLSKGAILIIFISLLFTTLVATPPAIPEAPVKIEINVSKDKIYVGDSIYVYATITLLKEHPNYEKGKEYHLVEKTNYTRLPSGKEIKKSNPLWIVLYSDSIRIINDENTEVNFHYRIKLNRKPDYKEVPIMEVVVAEITEGYIGRKKSDSVLKSYKSKYILIECLNEGLKERPEFLNKCPGEIPDIKLKLSPEIRPDIIELDKLKRGVPVKTEDLIKIVDVNESFLNKYKDKQGFHVLVNSTITFIFDSPVSNVSCDASIGYAYQSASNEITFESASTVGATGYIYFFMDGQNWQMQIELVGSYNIQGSFRYEKSGNDDYLNASGEAILLDYVDPNNPFIIDQQTLNEGSYIFNDVTCPVVGIVLLLNNSTCEIVYGEIEGGQG